MRPPQSFPRKRESGGASAGLHKRIMEESIVGFDINALASHMTAAGLVVVLKGARG